MLLGKGVNRIKKALKVFSTIEEELEKGRQEIYAEQDKISSEIEEKKATYAELKKLAIKAGEIYSMVQGFKV